MQFANDHEGTWDREVTDTWGVYVQDPPPWNRPLGPVHDRGPVSDTVGAGSSFTWIEPERRMVVVVRWLNSAYADAFFGRVLEAVDAGGLTA